MGFLARLGLHDTALEAAVVSWLSQATYRGGRRFLESHPALLERKIDGLLSRQIAKAKQSLDLTQSSPRADSAPFEFIERTVMVEGLLLLQAIRKRGRGVLAIRAEYVNCAGGFALDLPPWLEEVEAAMLRLCQEGRPSRTWGPRYELLGDALAQAGQTGGIAPEIIAELHVKVSEALHDNQGTRDRRETQEESCHHLEFALQIYTAVRYPRQYARIQNRLALTYIERVAGKKESNLETGSEACMQALEVAKANHYPIDIAEYLTTLGTAALHRVRGVHERNIEASLSSFRESLRIYAEAERAGTFAFSPTAQALAHLHLGDAYRVDPSGQHEASVERAISSYQEALQLCPLAAFPSEYAQTQTCLGDAYFERTKGERVENLKLASVCYDEALRVITLDESPAHYRAIQKAQALIAGERGQWEAVRHACIRMLDAEDLLLSLTAGVSGRATVLESGRSITSVGAFALARLGRPEAAVALLERGRTRGIIEALTLRSEAARIADESRRAAYLDTCGNYLAAQAEVDAPLARKTDFASRQGVHWEHATTSEQRVEYLRRIEACHRARQNFHSVVDKIRKASDPPDLLARSVNLADIAHQSTDIARWPSTFVYLVDTPWGGMAIGVFRDEDGVLSSYDTLELPLLTSSLVDQLFKPALPFGNSRMIGGYGYAQQGGILPRFLRDWAGETLREKAGRLSFACSSANVASTLRDTLEALLKVPWVMPLADRAIDLVDVWYNEQTIDGLTIQEATKLAATVDQWMLQHEVARSLNILGQVAMMPITPWLNSHAVSGVTVVPCGYLAAFPLLAATTEEGKTFGDCFAASIAPSAQVFQQASMRLNPEPLRDGLYAVGDPRRTAPPSQPLPWSEAEALTAAKIATTLGENSHARIGWSATREWLLEALSKGIVVVASCHGAYSSRNSLDSRLFLAGAQAVTLEDMLRDRTDLHGLRLIVLSACQTSLIDTERATDEVQSLAVGTLQAGARAVLATLWPVDDKATYLFIVQFLREWLPTLYSSSPEPPARALARAQQWLRSVRNQDLREWRANGVPQITVADRAIAGSSDVDFDPWTEPDHPVATLTPIERSLVVRRSGVRYNMWEAEGLISRRARRDDPTFQPFVDDTMWAGFQIVGW